MAVEEVPEEVIDLAFRKIGSVVSLLEDCSSEEKPPARALAVSNRYGLTFYATPSGFGVLSTKELVELAKEASPCVTSKSLVRIELENIDILALSEDDLTLAICCGSQVRLYSVGSLIHKAEKNTYEVRDIGDGAKVQDFQWSSLEVDKCFVLSSKGSLFIGGKGEELKLVKDNVAAACWNSFGKQIAYAVDMKLTISGVDFVKSSTIDLPTEHPVLEEGLEFSVDSLRWISKNTMLVSYVQEEEEDEIACPLFALSSEEQLNEESSACRSFAIRAYSAIDATASPSKTGPYMLVQNLDPWKLVLTANRRSVDDHVVLLGWNSEGTLCAYSLLNNSWRPEVPMYNSSDDNVLTGLCVDRTSTLQQSDPNDPDQLLPPSPILICSLLDNRLCLYSILRLDGKEWYDPGLIMPTCSLDELKDKAIEGKPLQQPAVRTGNRNNQPVRSLSSSFATPPGIQLPFSASKTVNEQRKTVDQEGSVTKEQAEPGKITRLPSVKPLPSVISSQQKIEEPTAKKTVLSDMEAEIKKVTSMAEETEEMIWASSLTNDLIDKLEQEVTALSTKCDDLKRNVDEKNQLVEELRDQSLDVDAWRIYVGSRVEQASDSMYQDLWAHKRLHPELDVKRKHVLSADEKLKEQISELEAHLHALELNQRQRQSNNGWQFQSVQSLYSTVNSQLEAAEKLSLRLGDLMEMLNISPSIVTQRNRKLEKNSVQKMVKTDKAPAKPTKVIIAEDLPPMPPESTRRRRDSIDGAWTGVGTTRATIKRISRSIQAESEKDIADSKAVSQVRDKLSGATRAGTLDRTGAVVVRSERVNAVALPATLPTKGTMGGSSSIVQTEKIVAASSKPFPGLFSTSSAGASSSSSPGLFSISSAASVAASSKPSPGPFSISSATTAAASSKPSPGIPSVKTVGASSKPSSSLFSVSNATTADGVISAKSEAASSTPVKAGISPATSSNGSIAQTGTVLAVSSDGETRKPAGASSAATFRNQVSVSPTGDSSISIPLSRSDLSSALISTSKVSGSASTNDGTPSLTVGASTVSASSSSAPGEAKRLSSLSFPSTVSIPQRQLSQSDLSPAFVSKVSSPASTATSTSGATVSSPAEAKPFSGFSLSSTVPSSVSTSPVKPFPTFAPASSTSSQVSPVKTPALESASALQTSPVSKPSSPVKPLSSISSGAITSSSTSSFPGSTGFSFIPKVAITGNMSASTGSLAVSASAEVSKPSGVFNFPFTAPVTSTLPSTAPASTSSIFKPQFNAASTATAVSTGAAPQTSGFGGFSVPVSPLFGTVNSTQSSSPFPALAGSPQQQQQQQQPSVQDADDDMDEETPSTSFSGFGLGSSTPSPAATRPNPFGITSPQTAPPGGLSTPAGQLFKPAAFAVPPASSQVSPFPTPAAPVTNAFGQPSGFSAFGQASQVGQAQGFGQASQVGQAQGFGQASQVGHAQGFGQASQAGQGQGLAKAPQVGPGQAALGSALGTFGQTRQVGFGASATPGTGISSGGGFATAASTGAGGFQAFSQGGGFGGFAAAGGSGFGFSPTFGSSNSAPKSDLFTTMRK